MPGEDLLHEGIDMLRRRARPARGAAGGTRIAVSGEGRRRYPLFVDHEGARDRPRDHEREYGHLCRGLV